MRVNACDWMCHSPSMLRDYILEHSVSRESAPTAVEGAMLAPWEVGRLSQPFVFPEIDFATAVLATKDLFCV